MFITIKKHSLVIFLCVSILATGIIVYFTALRPTFMPKAEHVIVIDAGHGGIDGGAVGKQTGVDESSLNLEYAMTLKKLCSDFGFEVVLTRSDMNGLYDISAGNKKRSEMEKRRQIIAKHSHEQFSSLGGTWGTGVLCTGVTAGAKPCTKRAGLVKCKH